jgi:hypothetical protein
MAKRITERQQLAQKLYALTDAEIAQVLDFIALIESANMPTPVQLGWDDELVALLSEARENKRARQAFAWESLRRRLERRMAMSGFRA